MKTDGKFTFFDNHSFTADALVSYLRDCKMKAPDLVPPNLALALEYVYQPNLTFWREFHISLVIHALDRYLPNWREAVSHTATNAADQLIKEIESLLRSHAFDEANAERLLAVHGSERPSDRVQASEWIHGELTRQGLHDDAANAARDGYRCGEAALEITHCLERAANGLQSERLGTGVARFYRNAVMNDTNPTVDTSVTRPTVGLE